VTVEFSTYIGPGFHVAPTYEAMFFPAGEAHLKVVKEHDNSGPLTQIARIYGADGNDMFLLGMWADACARRNEKTVLFIPYLPGARADHYDFVPMGAWVYAQFINSLNINQIVCFDPHSATMPLLINYIKAIHSTRLGRQYVVGHADDEKPQRYQGIIAPDKGAVLRAAAVAEACHLPLYKAEKHRDEDTGKLSGFSCETLPDEGKFLIVDDICDGGGTFIGLAEAMGVGRDRLGLYVSHGVFSGQAYRLFEHFGEIWTTDSLTSSRNLEYVPTGYDTKINIIPLDTTLRSYIQ